MVFPLLACEADISVRSLGAQADEGCGVVVWIRGFRGFSTRYRVPGRAGRVASPFFFSPGRPSPLPGSRRRPFFILGFPVAFLAGVRRCLTAPAERSAWMRGFFRFLVVVGC